MSAIANDKPVEIHTIQNRRASRALPLKTSGLRRNVLAWGPSVIELFRRPFTCADDQGDRLSYIRGDA